MWNVLAVKSVRSMPCKAIGKKKKKLIKTEETFAKRPVLWTWPACDFFFFYHHSANEQKSYRTRVQTHVQNTLYWSKPLLHHLEFLLDYFPFFTRISSYSFRGNFLARVNLFNLFSSIHVNIFTCSSKFFSSSAPLPSCL